MGTVRDKFQNGEAAIAVEDLEANGLAATAFGARGDGAFSCVVNETFERNDARIL